MKRIFTKISLIFLIALSFLGMVFSGLLIHEYIHVKQSKNPVSYCYDMQQKTFMSVGHNLTSEKEFNEFKTFSEKTASIFEFVTYFFLSFCMGIASVYVFLWKEI